jgi:tetratricopeptide (TPR) repeat protein
LETYRRFVRETALRFAGTSDPVAAEQVIKNSLLLPADAEILDLLKPLVEVVHAAVSRHDPKTPGDDRHVAWQTLALSLHQYRLGNYNEALAWARRSLEAYRDRTDARLAMTQALLALSNARLNRLQAAREALDTAMGPVNKNLPSGLERIVGQGRLATGVWHDWVISKLLIQEAQSLTTAP